MASHVFLLSEHCWVFTLFVFFLNAAAADSNLSSFSFSGFDNDSKLESSFALYGDAKVVDGGNAVQLTDLASESVGQVVYKKPIKLVEGESKKLMYFSTNFSFSVFPDYGNGLAFNIAPPTALNLLVSSNGSEKQKLKAIVVHFKTFRDSIDGNLLQNRVGIYVGDHGLSDATNSSSLRDFVSNNVEKLQAWIDYVVGTGRLEVRLGKDGDLRPTRPLLSYPINFMQLWGEEEVFISLSSSSGNSSQKFSIYSWSFELKTVPKWLHSRPADLKSFAKDSNPLPVKQKNDCFIRVIAAMVFGTGTGALTAFVVLFLWTILRMRRQVMPEEYSVGPVDSKYKKVEVLVLEKSIEDGKKVDV